MNLLIGVGHVNLEPWISINMTQKTSWRTRKSDETKIIDLISFDKIKIIPKLDNWFISQLHKKYVGSIAKPFMDFASIITPKKIPKYKFDASNNQLFVKSFSTYLLYGRRSLAAIHYFVDQTDAKFFFQTNTSSFIDIKKLEKFLKALDSNALFAAGKYVRDPSPNSLPVISGAGRLITRSAAIRILNNFKSLKYNSVEDVCMGRLIHKLKISTFELPRADIESPKMAIEMPFSIIEENFHFRCKTILREDSKIMQILDKRIVSNK